MINQEQPGVAPYVTGADVASRLKKIASRLEQEVTRLSALEPLSSADKQLAVLRAELNGIGRLIAETRAEIAGLQPSGLAHSHLVSASDELDAVVSATERAAVEIMVSAERSREAAQRIRKLPDIAPEALRDLDVIEAAALDVFVAGSFQDLTGQRIRKVVAALSHIEKRVMALTLLWKDMPGADGSVAPPRDPRNEAQLLHGPDDSGLRQNNIDRLLGGKSKSDHVAQDDVDALFADLVKSPK
jgi:chemotaxis protein CheZ